MHDLADDHDTSFLSPVRPLLDDISVRADSLDRSGKWPADDLRLLAGAGVMRWGVPREFGGMGLDALELHRGYELIASASLTVALILSQRDSAIGLVDASEQSPRRSELARLAAGEFFATVGIAQLTTSRQGGPPALRATASDNGFILNGIIPWSTGAAFARWVVAGAVTEDDSQVLFILDPSEKGVAVDAPAELVSLGASWTAQVRCENVRIDTTNVLRGPAPKVLIGRRNLTLGQTFLGMGLCRAGLNLIHAHRSAAAGKAYDRLSVQLIQMRREIIALSALGREADASAANPRLRGAMNDLALRITHAAVALYKGSALLAGHPAQRLAREAMFLLVWSCPDPVIDCTVGLLSEPSG